MGKVCSSNMSKNKKKFSDFEDSRLEEIDDSFLRGAQILSQKVLIEGDTNQVYNNKPYFSLYEKFKLEKDDSMKLKEDTLEREVLNIEEIRLLSQGSQGRVYKGYDLKNHKFVAIKKILMLQGHKNFSEFFKEINMLKKINHPNIIKYFDYTVNRESIDIYTEYMDRGSLEKLIKKKGNLKDDVVRLYTKQICQGLLYLHSNNIIHRDIKCSNILVNKNQEIKIADLGCAKKIEKEFPDSIKGSFCWMAPEMIERKVYDRFIDIWQLGCTVYEMITGYSPFKGRNQFETLNKIVNFRDNINFDDRFTQQARDFIKQCLKRDPNQRKNVLQLLEHEYLKSPIISLESLSGLRMTTKIFKENLNVSVEMKKKKSIRSRQIFQEDNQETIRNLRQGVKRLTIQKSVEKTRRNPFQLILILISMNLPIYQKKEEIIESIKKNKITLICGDTGCGKTTQVPQLIYKNFNLQKMMGITQPRRISAISVAERVAQEMSVGISDLVGYKVRFEEKLTKETKIKFMTDGILLKEFNEDKNLHKYDFIIIDEAHERGLNSDVILGLLKTLAVKNQHIKIILMSATLETDKFLKFFNTHDGSVTCQLIQVEGRFFPIEIFNVKEPVSDFLTATVNTILQINFNEEEGDVLTFLPGREDIETVGKILKKRMEEFGREFIKKDIEIIPLYSALPPQQQRKVFLTYKNKRKIILATNIAETALTINGVKFVIDCGYVKLKVYDTSRNLESLLVCPISRSSGIQRAGRAGRMSEGKCYRLYTKETFEKLEEFNIPEIQRSNLELVTLLLKSLKIDNLNQFPLIDKPDPQTFKKCLQILKELEAIDEKEQITQKGRMMLEFPLDPFASSCLMSILNEREEIQQDVLCILALLNTDNIILFRQIQKQEIYEEFKKKFFVPNSDHLTYLKILYSYVAADNKKQFCNHFCLRKKSLDTSLLIKDQLSQIFNKIRVKLGHKDNSINSYLIKNRNLEDIINEMNVHFSFDKEKILTILKLNFFNKIGERKFDHHYYINQLKAKIHPESFLFFLKEKPKKVLFNTVIYTTNHYISIVSEVN